jgi:hypothetical protein
MNFPERLDPEDMRLAAKEWRLAGLELFPYLAAPNLHIDVGRYTRDYAFDPEATYTFEGGVWVQISTDFSSRSPRSRYFTLQGLELTDGLFDGDWKHTQP